ncbi:MAG: carboxypeptidase-like regulatory domain-containing protein [Bryobacteraceae bacterium]|jgi:hypothetical protein
MAAIELLSKSALPLLLLCACAAAQRNSAIQDPSDPRRGRLEGFVQDENGQPLAGATVRATPTGVILATIVPNTRTDAKGRFALAGLLPVHTYLHAGKEDAFYPNTSYPVWNAGAGSAEVDVPEGGEISGILLKVAPAARVEVKATDAGTGAAIHSVGFHIERDGSPERWMDGGHIGDWTLVPTEPIRLRVDARGYEPAWYSEGNAGGQASPLRLAARQVLTIAIQLSPAKIAPGIPLSFCCYPSSDFKPDPAAGR